MAILTVKLSTEQQTVVIESLRARIALWDKRASNQENTRLYREQHATEAALLREALAELTERARDYATEAGGKSAAR